MDRSTNSSTGSLNADPPQYSSGRPDASRVHSSSTLRSEYSKDSSTSSSLNQSPLPSRDPSPSRLQPRSTTANTSRSRKNSQHDMSPSRAPKPTIPVAPPGSRTLSRATTPTLLPAAQSNGHRRVAAPQKTSDHFQAKESPRWPVSPRLRSPPPQLSRPPVSSMRRAETDPPRISVQRPIPSTDNVSTISESETEDSQTPPGVRTPAMTNGPTLETVQEVSQPNSPGSLDADLDKVNEKLADEALAMTTYPTLAENKNLRLARANAAGIESGSDSGSIRADSRRPRTSAPPPTTSRQSSAVSAKQGKNKPAGDGPAQTMIVETETVTSIPQVALGPGSKMEGGGGGTGTLRAKPSTETIKPRKEKRKSSRKQPAPSGTGETPHLMSSMAQYKLRHHQSMRSVSAATDGSVSPTKSLQEDEALSPRPNVVRSYHIGSLLTRPRPASSKADFFEAKIASAVDEADSSDSEETFVYDSNPPDGGDRPRRFHHSRTPSTTSMASQVDRSAMRSIHAVMESGGNQAPPLRKGMKFVNTFAGGEAPMIGEEDGDGSARSTGPGSGRGTTRRHHNHTHVNRWGRNNINSHTSLFDNESPFPNAARSKFSGNQSRQSSGPPSPRMTHHHSATRGGGGGINSTKRSLMPGPYYDLDDTTGPDDERTPLISPTVRRGRNRRNYVDLRHLECQAYRQKPSYLNRFAACLVVTMMLLLVVISAIGFMFATSQPLTDIELVSIRNVVASDPELMFDVTVKSHNPNIVVITVDQANIEVFAKSPHAGTDMDWWKSPHGPIDHGRKKNSDVHVEDDPPYEPPDDEAAPNMHLGTITEFDSPLSFEGSFFNKGVSTSTGGMRLSLPGNHSAGGSERWGRIIQDDFVLVLKGVVRYTLPLSQRVRSASVTGRTTVKPNSASDPSLNSTLSWDGNDP